MAMMSLLNILSRQFYNRLSRNPSSQFREEAGLTVIPLAICQSSKTQSLGRSSCLEQKSPRSMLVEHSVSEGIVWARSFFHESLIQPHLLRGQLPSMDLLLSSVRTESTFNTMWQVSSTGRNGEPASRRQQPQTLRTGLSGDIGRSPHQAVDVPRHRSLTSVVSRSQIARRLSTNDRSPKLNTRPASLRDVKFLVFLSTTAGHTLRLGNANHYGPPGIAVAPPTKKKSETANNTRTGTTAKNVSGQSLPSPGKHTPTKACGHGSPGPSLLLHMYALCTTGSRLRGRPSGRNAALLALPEWTLCTLLPHMEYLAHS